MTGFELGCRHLGSHRAACVAACAAPAAGIVGWPTALLRLFRLTVALAVALPICLLRMAIPGYARQRRRATALRRISRTLLNALGVEVTVRGEPRTGPSLVVANHTSWLDVLALCATAPMVPVAKSEVADWPLVGPVARRSGAVFIRRNGFRNLKPAIDEMTTLLRQGHRVQIFPEATTRCGLAQGEFYRSGFQAALDAAVVVQPAAIEIFQHDKPTTATAFVGDQTLAAVLFKVVRMRGIGIELRWLRPIPAIAGTGRAAVDRASVCRLTENAIARSLGRAVVLRKQASASRPGPARERPAPVTAGGSWQSAVSRGRF